MKVAVPPPTLFAGPGFAAGPPKRVMGEARLNRFVQLVHSVRNKAAGFMVEALPPTSLPFPAEADDLILRPKEAT
jgi:hypothetical protein